MKTRFLSAIAIICALFSCSDHEQNDKTELYKFSPELVIGEWKLDSSDNKNAINNRLFVLSSLETFEFSAIDGGSLLAKGNIKLDSLRNNNSELFHLELIDSNNLKISGGWSKTFKSFKRQSHNIDEATLNESLKKDSLRQKVVGWWQLINSKSKIKLNNFHGYYDDFTLNIREDGLAKFYLENQFDSIVNYSYRMNSDGIEFSRGCLKGANSVISFDSKGNMKLILERNFEDTLTLERLTRIKR